MKKKINGHGRRTLGVYGAYNFREKEPAIDVFRTLVEDHFGHRVTNRDLVQINEDGGPSVGCMRGWLFGDTLRPTNAAMEAAGRSLGYERIWRRMKSNRREDR